MSIFTPLLTKRRVKKAFAAVDANDVVALEALNIDPNTQRNAVLEGHTFNWQETLLSRAVRQDAFAVAQWLLINNANPLGGDGVCYDLMDDLLRRARRAQVRDGEVVEKAMLFMRYIRKQLQAIEEGRQESLAMSEKM